MSFETSALVLAWLAILVLALGLSGLLRHVHALATVIDGRRASFGPQVGTRAPDRGEGEGRSSVGPRVLLFADTECGSCGQALEELDALAAESANGMQFEALFPEGSDGYEVRHVHVLADRRQAFTDYRIPMTPFAVAVSSVGTIVAAEPVGSRDAMRQFIETLREA